MNRTFYKPGDYNCVEIDTKKSGEHFVSGISGIGYLCIKNPGERWFILGNLGGFFDRLSECLGFIKKEEEKFSSRGVGVLKAGSKSHKNKTLSPKGPVKQPLDSSKVLENSEGLGWTVNPSGVLEQPLPTLKTAENLAKTPTPVIPENPEWAVKPGGVLEQPLKVSETSETLGNSPVFLEPFETPSESVEDPYAIEKYPEHLKEVAGILSEILKLPVDTRTSDLRSVLLKGVGKDLEEVGKDLGSPESHSGLLLKCIEDSFKES